MRIEAEKKQILNEKLQQEIIKLKSYDSVELREGLLTHLIANQLHDKSIIVFLKTKKQCHRLAIILRLLNIKANELHGNMD